MSTFPDLFQLGLADVLAPHQRILIAGAGGGFDVFAGLPLYFSLAIIEAFRRGIHTRPRTVIPV